MAKFAVVALALIAVVLAAGFFVASNRDDPQAIERSQKLVAKYDSYFMLKARQTLDEFWSDNPAGARLVSDKLTDTSEYGNFVKDRLPNHKDARGVLASLVEVSGLYDKVYKCDNDTKCASNVLSNFFCPLATEQSRKYQFFFDFIHDRTKLELGASLLKFSEQCAS